MNTAMPKISFVIPIYNSVGFFARTIKSLLFQTFRNIEIIVINDGSTDSIQELMDHYCKKDKRIQYINDGTKRKGAAYRRNQGNKLAKADIICVTDAGDECHSEKAKIVYNYFKKYPDTDLLYHSVKSLDIRGRETVIQMAFPPSFSKYPRGISHPSVSYKRSVIIKYPYRTDCIHTDQYEAMLMILKNNGCKFEYIRNVLLQKWDMQDAPDYRNIKEASKQKIKIYKEFGIHIEDWIKRRAYA